MTICPIVFMSFVVHDNKVCMSNPTVFSISRRYFGKEVFFRVAFVRPYLISGRYDLGRCSAVKLIYINRKLWFLIA